MEPPGPAFGRPDGKLRVIRGGGAGWRGFPRTTCRKTGTPCGLQGCRNKTADEQEDDQQGQPDNEGQDEANNEFREALPDFGHARPILRRIDVLSPDIAKHEGPDTDENVDENFYRGGDAKDPAGLIADAFGRR